MTGSAKECRWNREPFQDGKRIEQIIQPTIIECECDRLRRLNTILFEITHQTAQGDKTVAALLQFNQLPLETFWRMSEIPTVQRNMVFRHDLWRGYVVIHQNHSQSGVWQFCAK